MGTIARLSPRERAVLRLVALGLENKEISQELDIKVSTVKGYVASILHRLDVPNRTAAAGRWHEETSGGDEPKA